MTKRNKATSLTMLAFGLLVGLPFLLNCVTTVSNRRAFILVSEQKMHTLGKQTYDGLRKKEARSKNTKLRSIVFRIGKRIAAASGKRYQWEFDLFDAPKKVNAFCLPGGKIGIYTGIFPVAKTEAGLAAIMGHEVAHATLRHGAERMSQAMAANAGLKLANVFLKGSKNEKLYMGALGLGAKVGYILPYSRKHETEADLIGIKYMAKAGYDPREAIGLWVRMSKLSKGSVEMLSTHPDSLKRAENIKKNLQSAMSLYSSSQKQPSTPLPPI